MDNFAFKYEYLQRIAEIKHVQRRIWEIVNKEHPSHEDVIRLKGLSELKDNIILLAEIYDALPGIDSFIVPSQEQQQEEERFTVREKVFDSKARASNAELARITRYTDSFGNECESAEHPDYPGGPIHPDYKGRYPWDEGYEGNAKF